MNLSRPFIQRPVGTTLLAIGVALAGAVGFTLLPVASLPQIEFPTINVTTSLPGASPEIMASSVATPLERQFGRIAGITQMTSASTLGATNVTLQFDLTRDIDGAARDVQAAINAARSQLPSNLPNNPTYRKINPADAPILVMTVSSSIYSKGQMYDAASTILQQKLSQIQGVGQVLVGGSSLPAVRVELNPTALNQYGIGLEDVRSVLANTNVNLPKGQLVYADRTANIAVNDQMYHAYEYNPLIITFRNNAPVRLQDVAQVTESVENVRAAGLSDGQAAVVLVIFKQPGANVIETNDRVYQLIPALEASIPAGMHLNIVMDRTTTIRASLHDVELTLIIAVILVILVVYIFLGNARAAAIPSVAVPLSLLGTFGIMYLFGYSLDNLSLMALTISTGFVVDDAVVMLENISRHIEAGMKPLQAALQGSKEVGFTVVSMSTSLVAVFLPILLMGGIVGRLFREFAMTLSIAIVMSLIVSLTVTPMMCARILKSDPANENHENLLHRGIKHLRNGYEHSLKWSLMHHRFMLLLTFIAVISTVVLFIIVPKGFFPQQDTGRISGIVQAQQNISFQLMQQKLSTIVNTIHQDPAVKHVVGFIGGSNNTANSGFVFITLNDLVKRKLSSDQIIGRLRNKLKNIAGAILYMQSAQDLVIGGRLGNAQFQYTLWSPDLKELNQWAPKVTANIAKLPGLVDVSSDQLSNGLQSYVTYDLDTAKRFGIASRDMDNTLYDAFGQRQVSIMYTLLNQYHVVMEVAPQYWQYPAGLNNIYVTSTAGKQVPLAAIAHANSSTTLLAVNHQSQFPSATISFNLTPGMGSLGDAVKLVNKMVTRMRLPHNITGMFQGTAQAFQSSLASEPYLILMALFIVYLVLGILYESLIHPLTILSTLPSAGVGALLALLLTRTDFSIVALIGMLLLIGIVKKNAIMMIDFALELERNHHKTSQESIYEAAVLRFRPIMMTTMAALFGALPLVIAFGVGAEIRRPLGIAIVGGLIVSQMLTLYTTPVVYLTLDRYRNKFNARRLRWQQDQANPSIGN